MTISLHDSSSKLCQATVVSTTAIHLTARQALDFAEYLEAENAAEILLEHRVLDSKTLKEPSEDGFFLDQALLAQVSPDAVNWLEQHGCSRLPGCRVAQHTGEVMDNLLSADYRGGRWDTYAVIIASALEISIALELRECPCLLQLELPGAGYTVHVQ
jgi:hypothetical protein